MIKEGWKHTPQGGYWKDCCAFCGDGVKESWLHEGCREPLPAGKAAVWRLTDTQYQVGVVTGDDPKLPGLFVSWNLSNGEVDCASIDAEDILMYLENK